MENGKNEQDEEEEGKKSRNCKRSEGITNLDNL